MIWNPFAASWRRLSSPMEYVGTFQVGKFQHICKPKRPQAEPGWLRGQHECKCKEAGGGIKHENNGNVTFKSILFSSWNIQLKRGLKWHYLTDPDTRSLFPLWIKPPHLALCVRRWCVLMFGNENALRWNIHILVWGFFFCCFFEFLLNYVCAHCQSKTAASLSNNSSVPFCQRCRIH